MARMPSRLVALTLATWAGVAGASGDHLACYKIKDTEVRARYTATVDGLVSQAGCTIQVPAVMACTPASNTSVIPMPPGGGGVGTPNSFTCYKAKCPKATFASVPVQDQFGTRTVTPKVTQLLCAPEAGGTTGAYAAFPATGQTSCWDSTGTLVPCAGTGQDADSPGGGALTYTDGGDGTITDMNTGLMWEKLSQDGSIHDRSNTYTWDQAFSVHVATLNAGSGFAGHTDWRVPNWKELASIVDSENTNPAISPAFNSSCMPGCTVLTCSCTQPDFYWSSSSDAGFPQYAWYVFFGRGNVGQGVKGTNTFYVRAVR